MSESTAVEAQGPGGLEADAASGRALAQREHERCLLYTSGACDRQRQRWPC